MVKTTVHIHQTIDVFLSYLVTNHRLLVNVALLLLPPEAAYDDGSSAGCEASNGFGFFPFSPVLNVQLARCSVRGWFAYIYFASCFFYDRTRETHYFYGFSVAELLLVVQVCGNCVQACARPQRLCVRGSFFLLFVSPGVDF